MLNVVRIAQDLLRYPSITPLDHGCQDYIEDFLSQLGFDVHRWQCGPVSNLWASRGHTNPCLVFAGHTDVVAPGPEAQWDYPPFEPTIHGSNLYGRGIVDMKGGLAAMMAATASFLEKHNHHHDGLGFLITSGEEGDHFLQGTPAMLEHLGIDEKAWQWCILGEPTSEKKIGDTIKCGRRGSVNGELNIQGQQGHVAYPERCCNPIHLGSKLLDSMSQLKWGDGDDFFPDTRLQVTSIKAGEGQANVIPNTMLLKFNIRYGNTDLRAIQTVIDKLIEKHCPRATIQWQHTGTPFLSMPGRLVKSIQKVVSTNFSYRAELSTGGGTSDGRFIHTYVKELVELGLRHDTAHKINEYCTIPELARLTEIYSALLEDLLLK